MISNKFSILFLVILFKISVILCSDSNDILQHLSDLEDGSTQEFGKIYFRDKIPMNDFEEFITMEEELFNKELGDGFKVVGGSEFEEMKNVWNTGFKVPAAFHFAEVEKEMKKEEFKTPETPDIKEVEVIIDKYEFKVPTVEEVEKETKKVLGPPHDDELEILGIAVMSRIVLYVAIVLLVLGVIVCTKICCRRRKNKRRRGFVRMMDSDKPKGTPDKLQPV